MLNLDWIARKLPESAGDPAEHAGPHRAAPRGPSRRRAGRVDRARAPHVLARRRRDAAPRRPVARRALGHQDRGPRDPPPRPRVDVVRARRAPSGPTSRASSRSCSTCSSTRRTRCPRTADGQRDPRPGAAGRRRRRRARGQRQRRGHPPRGPAAHLRSVLHDQAARRRHGPRPLDLPRHRDVARGQDHGPQHAQRGHDLPRRPAGHRSRRPGGRRADERGPLVEGGAARPRPGHRRRGADREHDARPARRPARRHRDDQRPRRAGRGGGGPRLRRHLLRSR